MTKNDKDLLFEFVKTDFTLRYNNSILGFLWAVLKPLLMFSVMYFVFSFFMGNTIKYYSLYLLIGIFMYNFFQEVTTNGLNSLLQKKDIILKVNFKRYLAVIGSTLIAGINLGFNLLVSVIFFAFNHLLPNPQGILFFLVSIIILYILALGIAFFISILHVKFRDLQHIWEILMLIFFYLTPIVYPISIIKGKFSLIIYANPLTHILTFGRNVLIYGKFSSVLSTFIILISSLLLLLLGVLFFQKNIKKIAEEF